MRKLLLYNIRSLKEVMLHLSHSCTHTYTQTQTQRPVIAAGIRGLVVAGGSYTGPAMNPMIAFGWAVQSGAYKVRLWMSVIDR